MISDGVGSVGEPFFATSQKLRDSPARLHRGDDHNGNCRPPYGTTRPCEVANREKYDRIHCKQEAMLERECRCHTEWRKIWSKLQRSQRIQQLYPFGRKNPQYGERDGKELQGCVSGKQQGEPNYRVISYLGPRLPRGHRLNNRDNPQPEQV